MMAAAAGESSIGPRETWRRRLETAATVAVILTCGIMAAFVLANWSALSERVHVRAGTRPPVIPPSKSAAPVLPAEPQSLDGAALKGRRSAAVALIEYADVQCPFCVRFAKETLPRLEQAYVESGKVLFAFQHRPIEAIHPIAFRAAAALECAGRYNQFWSMHDRVFLGSSSVSETGLRQYASELKLDQPAFMACLGERSVTEKVRQSSAHADTLGITGTPTFLIGLVQNDGRVKVTHQITGAQPYEQFKEALESALASASPK